MINEKSLQDYFNFIHLFKKQADPPFLAAVRHWECPPALRESLTESCPKGLDLESLVFLFCLHLFQGSSGHQDLARRAGRTAGQRGCVYVHDHTRVYMCAGMCVCASMCTCVCTCIHVHVCVHEHACLCACVYYHIHS